MFIRVFFAFYLIGHVFDGRAAASRTPKHLIFPSGSIFQFSFGVSSMTDAPPVAVQSNLGFQQNIKLPTNLTELLEPPPYSARNFNLDVEKLLASLGLESSWMSFNESNTEDVGFIEEVFIYLLSKGVGRP